MVNATRTASHALPLQAACALFEKVNHRSPSSRWKASTGTARSTRRRRLGQCRYVALFHDYSILSLLKYTFTETAVTQVGRRSLQGNPQASEAVQNAEPPHSDASLLGGPPRTSRGDVGGAGIRQPGLVSTHSVSTISMNTFFFSQGANFREEATELSYLPTSPARLPIAHTNGSSLSFFRSISSW